MKLRSAIILEGQEIKTQKITYTDPVKDTFMELRVNANKA